MAGRVEQFEKRYGNGAEPVSYGWQGKPLGTVRMSEERSPAEGKPLAQAGWSTTHGREPEMTRVSELLQWVATSRTSCELRISGPPGIGKTWLLSEVEKAAVHSGFELRRVGRHHEPRPLAGEPVDSPTRRPRHETNRCR